MGSTLGSGRRDRGKGIDARSPQDTLASVFASREADRKTGEPLGRVLKHNLKVARSYLLKEDFQHPLEIGKPSGL